MIIIIAYIPVAIAPATAKTCGGDAPKSPPTEILLHDIFEMSRFLHVDVWFKTLSQSSLISWPTFCLLCTTLLHSVGPLIIEYVIIQLTKGARISA